MTHRAHHRPATIPARRGMRASWFRGRHAGEPDDGPDTTPDLQAEDGPGDPPAGREPPAPPRPGNRTAAPTQPSRQSPASLPADPGPVTLLRPVHGHPTF